MVTPARLAADLQRHVERVAGRSAVDEAEIRLVAAAVPLLVDHLGLDEYVGVLSPDDKPRILLRFGRTSVTSLRNLGTDVVLKVYGDERRAEGRLLGEWSARGVPVPALETGKAGSCTWLLMECLPQVLTVDQLSTDWAHLTHLLAALSRRMHRPSPSLHPSLRPLVVVMLPRWRASREALMRSGRQIPVSWEALAASVYEAPVPVPLHGDLAVGNLGRRTHEGLVLFDASALLGPAVFDGARWCSRLASVPVPPLTAFNLWLATEGIRDPEAHRMLALECVLEAGSLEIVRSRTSTKTAGAVRDADTSIDELLRTARLVLG